MLRNSGPTWPSSSVGSLDPGTEIIGPDIPLYEHGLDLYARPPDKAWSLTDCISSVVMTERGLTEALTGDNHFEQAGFAPSCVRTTARRFKSISLAAFSGS